MLVRHPADTLPDRESALHPLGICDAVSSSLESRGVAANAPTLVIVVMITINVATATMVVR
jgi:hypothetical protein